MPFSAAYLLQQGSRKLEAPERVERVEPQPGHRLFFKRAQLLSQILKVTFRQKIYTFLNHYIASMTMH